MPEFADGLRRSTDDGVERKQTVTTHTRPVARSTKGPRLPGVSQNPHRTNLDEEARAAQAAEVDQGRRGVHAGRMDA